METSSGIQASLAGRYATALFDLAVDAKAIPAVESDLLALKTAIGESRDLAALISNPLLSRANAGKAIAAVAKTMKLSPLTTKFLGVLADNRRLAKLPEMITAFSTLAANHRGEVKAEVTSAYPLTTGQMNELKKQLRTRVGRDVSVESRVDPAILGGLVVRLGSQMIDSSIQTRLNSLANAMKG